MPEIKITKSQLARINNGEALKVASEMNIHLNTLKRMLARAGLKYSPKNTGRPANKIEVVE